jgi:hypothetical protein
MTFNRLHSVIFQEIERFITIAVRTSNFTGICFNSKNIYILYETIVHNNNLHE